jgi:uncharacterized protein (DUF1778 family)
MSETRLSIRIDEKELKALKAYAERENKTFSDWVRETLLTNAGLSSDKYSELEKRIVRLERKFLE